MNSQAAKSITETIPLASIRLTGPRNILRAEAHEEEPGRWRVVCYDLYGKAVTDHDLVSDEALPDGIAAYLRCLVAERDQATISAEAATLVWVNGQVTGILHQELRKDHAKKAKLPGSAERLSGRALGPVPRSGNAIGVQCADDERTRGNKIMTREDWDEECCLYQDERYVVAAIKKHLLTDDQRSFLQKHSLSIEDILNGRFRGDLGDEVTATIFKPWNDHLGWHEFGFKNGEHR